MQDTTTQPIPVSHDRQTSVLYTIAPCSLGFVLAASAGQGLCALHLGDTEEQLAALLAKDYPVTRLEPNQDDLRRWAGVLQDYLRGVQRALDLPLDMGGTEFQRRVWRALQAIPYGSTRTYTQLAEELGKPTATRAVASACAANTLALAIPCHRALREDGSLSGYRWGLARKDALLTMERFGL